LTAWIGFDLVKFSESVPGNDRSPAVLPGPKFGRAYLEYVTPVSSDEADFAAYQQIKRYFRGWRLVGFNQDAVYFAPLYDLEHNGPSISAVAAYEPDLTAEETRELAGRIIERRTRGFRAIGVVPPAPGAAPDTVVVLRGSDGMYFFVAAAMAPARFARLARDR
jgi:hypothetical protein